MNMIYTEVMIVRTKKCWESFGEHAIKIINFEKNETINKKEREREESYENAKIYYICKEKFENKYLKDKKYLKVRDHCHYTREYRGAAHSICNLKYSVPKKITIVFHNGSNYGYHFYHKGVSWRITFTCLGENTEKHITFTVPIEKEVTTLDKNREEITKNIFCILEFIDSARFMASSISNLVNNLSERINRIKYKFWHDDEKKCESLRIKYKYCDWLL